MFQVDNKKLLLYFFLSFVFWELARFGIADKLFDVIAFFFFNIFSTVVVYGLIKDWKNMINIFSKPYVDEQMFSQKDLFYMSFLTMQAASLIENTVLYDNIYDNLFSTLYAFVQALEAKDPYTRQHSDRVARFSAAIASEMGCRTEEVDIINFAGRLHDIGKIGVTDKVLLKPGKLTKEEFDMIKKHPLIGANIIGHLDMWDRERDIIKYHHERFDGTGYPEGLKGDKIPFLARILSVADAFDAMASDRAYRKKMKTEKIMEIIDEGSGTQFDPEVVKAFQKLYKQGKLIQETYNNRHSQSQNGLLRRHDAV